MGDLEYLMGWQKSGKSAGAVQQDLFIALNPEETQILDILRKETHMTIDQLALYGNIPVSKLSAMLLNLEFKGLVTCLPGKVYQLTTKNQQ
jgi:DNA processing protein